MMDLRNRNLPNAIEADGEVFLIETDFRIWMGYPGCLKDESGSGYAALFREAVPVPSQAVLDALDLFYRQPSEIPRGGQGAEPLVDWDIDADYIYAAFMQAYGIDLVDAGLHWHKFLALFHALPADTYMYRIMEHRSYEGDDREGIRLRQAWSLPVRLTDEEKKAADEFNELFG